MHRFGWLVEACNHEPMDDQDGGAGEVDDGDFDLDRTKTGIRRRQPGVAGAIDPDRAQHRVKGVEMVSCCLTLSLTPTLTPALTPTPTPTLALTLTLTLTLILTPPLTRSRAASS